VIAAVLVASNPYLIWYSQEARSYALLVAFGALGLWLFARSLHDPSRRTLGGWVAVASGLALCTHYFAIFAILAEAALLFARLGRRRARHDWRAGVAAARSPHGPQLYVVPADGRSPVSYYTGQRLAKFLPKRFRDGIATRSIVVLSDAPQIRRPAPGFRAASTRVAPQHWTVRTFVSRRPRPVSPGELTRRDVLPREPWTSLVAQPRRLRALEAGVDRRGRIEASRDRSRRTIA
jgi:hypothetical protein